MWESGKILRFLVFYSMLKEKGVAAMKCTECQNEIPKGSVFCPICGSAQFEETVDFAVQPEPVAESIEEKEESVAELPEKPRLKVKKKWWILAVAGLLLAVAAVVMFANRSPEYAVYATLDSLMLKDLSGGEPVRLAGNISLREMLLTKDGKRLFYQEGDDISTGYLYYLDLRSDPMEPVKLVKEARQLFINEQGTRLGYIRGAKLYAHDLESETLIAEDVTNFLCDEDVDTFAYARVTSQIDFDFAVYERIWYFRDGDGEEVLVGEGRKYVNVLWLSADGKTMIYSADNGINVWKNGEETVIADGAVRGYIYEDMSFYYETVNESGQAVVCFYDGKQSIEIPNASLGRAYGEQPLLRWQDEQNGQYFVAIRDRVLEIPLEGVMSLELARDGKTLYVTTQGEGKKRDLYSVDISREEAGQVQLLAENASQLRFAQLEGRFYYWVGTTGLGGTLYCDGERVLENVQSNHQTHEPSGTLLIRGETSPGVWATIYMVRDGKAVKLTDEGGETGFATNGDALVMTENAELWCFDRNGRGKLLANNAINVYSL